MDHRPDPLEYEGNNPERAREQLVRANQAMLLAGGGFAVMGLQFVFITVILHQLNLPEAASLTVYVLSVVVGCALGVAAIVRAASALKPAGPAASRAQLAIVLSLCLLSLSACCAGGLWMGDVS